MTLLSPLPRRVTSLLAGFVLFLALMWLASKINAQNAAPSPASASASPLISPPISLPASPPAEGRLLFGPKTYTMPFDGAAASTEVFVVNGRNGALPAPGVLTIQNGGGSSGNDGEDRAGGSAMNLAAPVPHVTSGSLTLNGQLVATVAPEPGRITVPAPLVNGANVLRVAFEGPVRSSLTVAIHAPAPAEPPINVGVLELPYGSIKPPLALEFCLKNKSHTHSRTVRLACINPEGRFSDVSPVFEIKPNGTLTIRLPDAGLDKPGNAGQQVAPGTWREGSVNVIWVGRGAEPVIGYVISGRVETGGALRERVMLPLIPQGK